MEFTMLDAILVPNYTNVDGVHRWDNVSDDLWWILVSHLHHFRIDGFGFQDVTDSEGLAAFRPFSRIPMSGTVRYAPYHADSAPVVAEFELTATAIEAFHRHSFDEWNRANDELPADEILFFASHRLRIQAIPYENLVFFDSFSREEAALLLSLHPVVSHSLFLRDMSALVAEVPRPENRRPVTLELDGARYRCKIVDKDEFEARRGMAAFEVDMESRREGR